MLCCMRSQHFCSSQTWPFFRVVSNSQVDNWRDLPAVDAAGATVARLWESEACTAASRTIHHYRSGLYDLQQLNAYLHQSEDSCAG